MLLGTSEAIPVADGQLKLGQLSVIAFLPPSSSLHSLIYTISQSVNTIFSVWYIHRVTYTPSHTPSPHSLLYQQSIIQAPGKV